MKNITKSLIIIGAIAAIVIGGTIAYFSDTETSTNNTFTAGAIDLQVKSQCSYNGVEGAESGQCGTWDYPADGQGVTLGKFFDFSDLKPGDWGENTISFKVVNNDAWMCANITSTNRENGINEPELSANDTTSDIGELGDFLSVFWWVDADGNNIYESGEKILYGGPRTFNTWLFLGGGSQLPLTFADSYLNWTTWPTTVPNTLPIPGGIDQNLGVGWCFGTLNATGVVTATGPKGFECDGSGDGNQNLAQTDGLTMDLTFSAVQSRNNMSYRCPENVSRP